MFARSEIDFQQAESIISDVMAILKNLMTVPRSEVAIALGKFYCRQIMNSDFSFNDNR